MRALPVSRADDFRRRLLLGERGSGKADWDGGGVGVNISVVDISVIGRPAGACLEEAAVAAQRGEGAAGGRGDGGVGAALGGIQRIA